MLQTKAVFALSLTASLLVGCAVGPNYAPPAVSEPARYLGQAAIEQRSAADGADLVSWWGSFEDPELTRLVDIALAQNLDLAQALARITQSRAQLRAATAALLPQGQGSASATTSRLSTATSEGQLLGELPGFERNEDVYELDAGASWEIDLFGGLRRNREAARAEYGAAKAGVAAARIAVAADVADAYVAIRGLQTRLAVAREQVETQQRLVALVQLQMSKGVAARLQLDQAQGALKQVEATVPALQTSLDQAFNALDVLLGAQPGVYRAELLAPAPIPKAPAITLAGGPADLLRRRPDLIVAERTLAASNARIGAAMSDYYPKVSLTGLIGAASGGTGELFTAAAGESSGVVGLRWRLFDFGRVDAEVASARGRNAEALAAYRLSVLRATEDVEDAFSKLVQSEAQAQTLAEGEAALERAREASTVAYKGGVVSLIEVLDADTRLLATRDARAEAATAADRAAVASFRALGGGWNPHADLVKTVAEAK
ncbi:MAG: efflux transporter outer membrane subunit [Caulobacteraceae bacterium]